MPVNNDTIKDKMDALEAKDREFGLKSRDCREARTHLQTIHQEQISVPDPTEEEPNKTKLEPLDVMDRAGGKKMTDSRRQEIHDYWMAKADTLLA